MNKEFLTKAEILHLWIEASNEAGVWNGMDKKTMINDKIIKTRRNFWNGLRDKLKAEVVRIYPNQPKDKYGLETYSNGGFMSDELEKEVNNESNSLER